MRILVTGGRAPVALDWAERLTQCGHQVFIAESLRFYISQSSRFVAKCLTVPEPRFHPEEFCRELSKIIQTYNIDLLLPTCEEVFYVSQLLNSMDVPSNVLIYCSPRDKVLRQLHDKFLFNQFIAKFHKFTPRTCLATNNVTFEKILDGEFSDLHRYVLKPAYSRFATSALIVDRPTAQPRPQIDFHNKSWCVQEFIQGVELCSYSLCFRGKIYAHVTYRPGFRAGKGAAISYAVEVNKDVLKFCREIVEQFSFTGQISFDYILDKHGHIYPIECNPRATSGLHLFGTHQNEDLSTMLQQFVEAHRSGSGDHFKPPLKMIQPPLDSHGMVLLAMLIYGLPVCLMDLRRFSEWVQVLFRSRDLTLNLRNPWPFIYQFFVFSYVFSLSIYYNLSMLDVTTRDIEWNPETDDEQN